MRPASVRPTVQPIERLFATNQDDDGKDHVGALWDVDGILAGGRNYDDEVK